MMYIQCFSIKVLIVFGRFSHNKWSQCESWPLLTLFVMISFLFQFDQVLQKSDSS